MQIYAALVTCFGVNVPRSLRVNLQSLSSIYDEKRTSQRILKLTNFNGGFLEWVAHLIKNYIPFCPSIDNTVILK